MKTLNLYFDFEFTSLSPDAQPISLGIVSDALLCGNVADLGTAANKYIKIFEAGSLEEKSFSFYAEFSDFDIERCDDWVIKNVIDKLLIACSENDDNGNVQFSGKINDIKTALQKWLSEFSDYNIQFICDCGTFDWYWLLQLLAEWDEKQIEDWSIIPPINQKDFDISVYLPKIKTGLPKLPANISPVPFDLNDLIAIKKGITPKEAFDLNREELAYTPYSFREIWDKCPDNVNPIEVAVNVAYAEDMLLKEKVLKHNALWDAKVIKEIYNKLK